MSERLWAPWRLQYVSNAGKTEGEGCIFCLKPAEQKDAENLILWRSAYCFALLNLYPYTSGHTMVAPYRHTADIADLTPDESLDLWQLMQKCVRAIQQVYKPDGFNIGFNLGRAAGAGIEGHLHLHIVPRWHGDTNFMTTIGEVRVLPEALEQTHARLKAALEEAMRDGRTD